MRCYRGGMDRIREGWMLGCEDKREGGTWGNSQISGLDEWVYGEDE